MIHDFEPQITIFACHYCAYGAADLAGSMRVSYPAGTRIVKLPCTGKIDVLFVLGAFEHGADGVMVAGWLEGECHYLEGNVNAKRRVQYARQLLDQIGLGGERVQMFNLSSAQGAQFAQYCAEFSDKMRGLGPNPLRLHVADPERT